MHHRSNNQANNNSNNAQNKENQSNQSKESIQDENNSQINKRNRIFETIMISFPIIISGLLGGFATIFGKLAFSSDSLPINEISKLCKSHQASLIAFSSSSSTSSSTAPVSMNCETGILLIRLIAGGFMLASNAFVVGYFLRAVENNNTVVVIVISSAMNFLTSGIFGQLLFGEIVSQKWYFGSLLIILGMFLVASSQGIPGIENNKNNEPPKMKRLLNPNSGSGSGSRDA